MKTTIKIISVIYAIAGVLLLSLVILGLFMDTITVLNQLDVSFSQAMIMGSGIGIICLGVIYIMVCYFCFKGLKGDFNSLEKGRNMIIIILIIHAVNVIANLTSVHGMSNILPTLGSFFLPIVYLILVWKEYNTIKVEA